MKAQKKRKTVVIAACFVVAGNAVAIAALVLIVLSGLVVFKSVQFPLLRDLLGGYDNARKVHFVCMVVLVLFLIVHVAAAAMVPRSMLAMIRGRG